MAGLRKKKLDKGTEARRLARKSGIAPATTRIVPDKRNNPAKHKKPLAEEE
jgi:hypothetical protein